MGEKNVFIEVAGSVVWSSWYVESKRKLEDALVLLESAYEDQPTTRSTGAVLNTPVIRAMDQAIQATREALRIGEEGP